MVFSAKGVLPNGPTEIFVPGRLKTAEQLVSDDHWMLD